MTRADPSASSSHRLAEAVRAACIDAAMEAYEQAAMSGLCAEGAWECAVGAMRSLDVEHVLPANADAAEVEENLK